MRSGNSERFSEARGVTKRPPKTPGELFLARQRVDVTTRRGRLMLKVLNDFTADQSKRAGKQIAAGLRRARAEGKPTGRPPVSAQVEQAIRDKRAEGMGMVKIARELGVGTSTVQRVVADSK